MRKIALVLFVAACKKAGDTDVGDTEVEDTDPSGETDTIDTEDTDDTDVDDDPCTGSSDEALVRGLIEGCRTDVDGIVMQVAWSDGFPVKTSTGSYLVVVPGGGSDWSIAGDFNEWAPEAMASGDGFGWIEIDAPSAGLYKLVRPDSSYQQDEWARSYGYDQYGEYSLIDAPSDAYRLDWWPAFEGQGLAPRGIRVLVPPGDGPFDVLYMHDGQNLFDPEAFWGGWHVQDAVEALGEPILVVGIDNTADRMDEYTQCEDDLDSYGTLGGSGDAYAALVQEDIRPWIEGEYGSTGHDGVLGSSLGGLISLHIAHKYPGEFDFVGSMSGTLGWGRFGQSNPTMQELWLADATQDLVIYVDSGGDDGGGGCDDVDGDGFVEDDPNDGDNYCVTRAFADAMSGHGYVWDDTLFHWHDPGATHDEAHWAARLDHPLGIFEAN